MTDQNPEIKKFEKRLEGDPVVIGEYSVQPVAQVTGWHVTVSGEQGKGAGGLARVRPLEAVVSKGEDAPYTISLSSETEAALQGIAQAGIVVAALCGFGMIIAKTLGIFKEMKK